MQKGFSLVELSIVLVILGLLTGGILAGQNLIRASELRSITTQFSSYNAAVNTFRDKYFSLPGDFRDATKFWGSAPSCPGTAGTGTQTCDGNGDGSILTVGSGGDYVERYMFWQHLANAGLIEGSYTGMAGAGGNKDSVPDENVPSGKFKQSIWYADTRSDSGNTTLLFQLDYGNHFILGVDRGASNRPLNTMLAPAELWGIDTKMDDGRPAYGKVIAGNYNTCTDATSDTDYDSEYALSDEAIQCNALFKDVF